ncbi:MAG: family 1 encapsulin nanocompartment shell protein [Candidatus Izemoplasmataceae bacterium]
MDLFKQSLAPIPTEAWEEINERSKEVILSQLTARSIVNVIGPKGLDTNSISIGRLKEIKPLKSNEVGASLYEVMPLMETRIEFDLSRWELDNILRGVKDTKLDNLEDAVEKLTLFEEDTIYNGNKNAGIKGLNEVAGTRIKLTKDANDILNAISEGVNTLTDAFSEKPYDLIVSDEVLKRLNQMYQGGLLRKNVSLITGGDVIRSRAIKGAILIPRDHEDLELTIGQDYTIGYETHDKNNVTLFVMNSFTFRCLDEDIVVAFDID